MQRRFDGGGHGGVKFTKSALNAKMSAVETDLIEWSDFVCGYGMLALSSRKVVGTLNIRSLSPYVQNASEMPRDNTTHWSSVVES